MSLKSIQLAGGGALGAGVGGMEAWGKRPKAGLPGWPV